MKKIKRHFLGTWAIISAIVLVLSAVGCGGGNGGSSSTSGSTAKNESVKSSSEKTSAVKQSVQEIQVRVDVNSAATTISYPDKVKSEKRRDAARQYTIDTEVTLTLDDNSWDAIRKIFTSNASLTNNTSDTFYATIASIDVETSGVEVSNEYGYDHEGNPFFNHASGGESIAGSGTSSEIDWKFYVPDAIAVFSYTVNVYADNWHQIAGPGTSFGWDNSSAEDAADTLDNSFFTNLAEYNGKLYGVIGKQDHGNRDETSNPRTGAEVWEYEPTGGTYTQVNSDGWLDIDSDNYGVENAIWNNWGGAMLEYSGNLYVSGGKHYFLGGIEDRMNDGADLFRYNGSSWTKVYTNTDANALYNIFEFDGSIFAGTIGAGYGRTWKSESGSDTGADLSWSASGDFGSWTRFVTNAFGDVDDGGGLVGGAILGGGSISLGGATHGYAGKGGSSGKPGVVMYIADAKVGGGGGRLASDWTMAVDFASDDITKTVSAVTALATGSNEYNLTISGGGLTPHAHAHQYATITQSETEYTSVTVIDNTATNVIVGIHANHFTPATPATIRLVSGTNERGWGETGNATSSQFFVFAPSSEGSAGTTDQLWLLSSNLPQGIGSYINAGGQMFSVTNIQSDNTTSDSDWVRRMNSFTTTTEFGYATPSANGGANKDGSSVYSGFDAGIDPANPADVYGRSEFTIFPGSYSGWLYVTVQPFQRINKGCSIYKTADGVNWVTVTTDGFGNNGISFRAYSSAGGKFYAGGSRLASNDSVNSHPTKSGSGAITPSSTSFYEQGASFPSPTIHYPSSGALLLESKTNTTEPILLSDIYYEKITYTSNKVSTSATLTSALSATNGYVGKTLWATDTELVLSDAPDNLGLDSSKGAVCVEGEVINYNATSGSTLQDLTRGTGSPDFVGVMNHNAGAPVFRTTRIGADEAARQDGSGTPYGIQLGGTVTELASRVNDSLTTIVIDNEEIKYTQRTNSSGAVQDDSTGTVLRTPIRGFNSTRFSAHSGGAAIYKPGFDGLTRGAYGTTATNWAAGEDALLISLDPVELWVTDF